MKVVSQSDRLTIRQCHHDDAEFILRLLNEESFIRYIADKNVRSKKDAIEYLDEGPLQSYQKNGFGLNIVTLKSSKTPIGMCGLLKRETLDFPDIGFAFLPEYCGLGYATESVVSVIDSAIKSQLASTIQAVTLPDNLASNRLLKKVKFELIGTVELYDSVNNLYQYSKTSLFD